MSTFSSIFVSESRILHIDASLFSFFIAPCREHTSKALRYGTRSRVISQFHLHTPRSSANGMNHTYLCLLSRSWYSVNSYISPISPLILQGLQKCETRPRFLTTFASELPSFRNGATFEISKNSPSVDNWSMSSQNVVSYWGP